MAPSQGVLADDDAFIRLFHLIDDCNRAVLAVDVDF